MALGGLSGEAPPMDLLTRRMFLASCAATIAARSAGLHAEPASLASTPVPTSEPLRLYVDHNVGGLLSLGREWDTYEPLPPWTWRQYIMIGWNRDPEPKELDDEALEYAKECFSDYTGIPLDEEKGEYGEYATRDEALARFERWLEEPIPDRAMYQEVQFEWWHKHASGEAHAIQLLRTLNLKGPYVDEDDGEEDGIVLQCQFYNTASVDERGLERLRAAIQQHGLNIEIVETT